MSQVQVFSFNLTESVSFDVRTVMRDGQPWFVAADVAAALEYSHTPHMMRAVDADDAGVHNLDTRSANGVEQAREVSVVNESGLYSAIMACRAASAKPFKKWVTSEVLPSIRKTGMYAMKPTISAHPFQDAMLGVEVLARMLNLEGSAKLGMARAAVKLVAPHMLSILPAYGIDGPRGMDGQLLEGGSSRSTHAMLYQLKMRGHQVGTSGVSLINYKLMSAGLLEQKTRPSTTQGTKTYWSVTDAGLSWGKNVTHENNQRSTAPHWYDDRFDSLLKLIDLSDVLEDAQNELL